MLTVLYQLNKDVQYSSAKKLSNAGKNRLHIKISHIFTPYPTESSRRAELLVLGLRRTPVRLDLNLRNQNDNNFSAQSY